MPAAEAKTRAAKAKAKKASPSQASRKQPAPGTPEAEVQSPSLDKAKKRKAVPEESDQDCAEEDGLTAEPPTKATKDQTKHIKKLEKQVEVLQCGLGHLRNDRVYMNGVYDGWPEVPLEKWPTSLWLMPWWNESWGAEYSIKSRYGKYGDDVLSKEQKKQIIASMEGYVIQDDFDKTVSRLPPNVHYCILGIFYGIMVTKDIMNLFFTNPFWYLEWPHGQGMNDGEESGIATPFGDQLNHLYQTFLHTDKQLAQHWRAQTVRLSNANDFPWQARHHNPVFGPKNKAFREAKAKEAAMARLADKTFQCMLRPEDLGIPDQREESFVGLYRGATELAMGIATSQPGLKWKTLGELPSTFYRRLKEISPAHIHALWNNEPRLDGHSVLAVTQPTFWRVDGWNRAGPDHVICKGRVLIEDPIGLLEDALSTDEEEKVKKKQRKRTKKANDNEADTEKAPAKGQAKQGVKKET